MADPLVVVAIGALLGLALGMLGGGGGILAVPLLVAIGEATVVASTMSLAIIGTGAAAALVPHHRAGRVDWPVGLTFGALGVVGAAVGAWVGQLASPAVVLGGMTVLLIVGATLTLRAARRDWLQGEVEDPVTRVPAATGSNAGGVPTALALAQAENQVGSESQRSRVRMIGLGTSVGFVTGFFGVGAGFVVVPALIVAMRLPIKTATATALVVIVMNSSVAVVIRHQHLGPPPLTAGLVASTVVFAVVGATVSRRVPGWILSGVFGSLMALVALYTLARAGTAL